MKTIYCSTGKSGWSTYYDAYFLKKYITDYNFVLKSVSLPNNKNDILLFTDPGAFCSVAADVARFPNKIVCWWHGDINTNNNGVQKRIPIAQKHLKKCKKIIVSCQQGMDSVLSFGVDPEKICLIPLGVDLDIFYQTSMTKCREKYNIPQNSFCVGSFQRDTDKLGGPKWIKGPDVISKSLGIVNQKIDDLFVVLSGPRRSYITKELRSRNIKVLHVNVSKYEEMFSLYNCLNCYIIGSRVEGGPKSLIESTACGVPVVSTDCGMASDVITKSNGFLVPVDDFQGLSSSLLNIYNKDTIFDKDVVRQSILRFDYKTNICLKYKNLFDGFD